MLNLIIGTRASKLAMWQAAHVKSLIELKFNISCELKKISTKGDEVLDRSLVEIGGKGVFLKEIEDALLDGSIDLAVHSMKDVPSDLPDGLVMAAVLQREDHTDSFVSINFNQLTDLPHGARVGTSSLRRSLQILNKRPDLKIVALRGNVDTRLKKLQNGEFDAIVLATAGLMRLGLKSLVKQKLDFISASGQGAIGIECRVGDADLQTKISSLDHVLTSRCVNLERYFIKKLGGNCQTPIGCHVTEDVQDKGRFSLRCFWAQPDGSGYHEKTTSGVWSEGQGLIDKVII